MSAKITINAQPRWPDVNDDYAVQFEGHSIGRVRLDGTNWVWSITIPMALPEWAEGSAASRDEGFKALAAAWGKLLAQTDPERLQRAWELEKAFEAREQKTDQTGPGPAVSLPAPYWPRLFKDIAHIS